MLEPTTAIERQTDAMFELTGMSLPPVGGGWGRCSAGGIRLPERAAEGTGPVGATAVTGRRPPPESDPLADPLYENPVTQRIRSVTVTIDNPTCQQAADIAVIKCTPLGGVRRALQVAEAAGLPCVVSSALETSVGLAAQLALAGALPELDFACGLGPLSLLDGDLVTDAESLRPVDGYLPVLRRPPSPDPTLLSTYELTDPEQAAWWHNRLTRVRAELRSPRARLA